MTFVPQPSAFCLWVISVPIHPIETHPFPVDGGCLPQLGGLDAIQNGGIGLAAWGIRSNCRTG